MSPYYHLTAQAVVGSLTKTGSPTTPSHTVSPTFTMTASASPTPGAVGSCAATDHLDLEMAVINGATSGAYACSDQFPDMMFRITNNNASAAVNVNTLTIEGWFNAGANSKDWGGDSYRTAVYSGPNGTGTNLGQVAATCVASVSGLGGTKATLWTFTFTTSVSIPAGGSVIAGTVGTPFIQFDGANNSGQAYAWDPNCNDYTGLGDGAYAAGSYYHDPTWMLYESGNPVCEWLSAVSTDPNTGIPASGATCSCPPSAPVTPTASPTPTVLTTCATTDHLDLEMAVINGATSGTYICGNQFPDMMFRITNNNTSAAVDVSTLAIQGWFNAGANSKDWGGDSYRTAVYSGPNGSGTNLGQVAATCVATSSGLGGTKAELWTFTFTTSVSIPAGGSVMAGTFGTPFIQFDGANNGGGSGYAWDPGCNDYTGLGYGTYTAGAYYHDPTWMLTEGGLPVCEWNSTTSTDPNTGIPAGGVSCTCPSIGGPSPSQSPTSTVFLSPVPSQTSGGTATMSATPSPTPTYTTGSGACVTTDHLDLQMSVFNGANGGIYACTDQFPDMMFMVNNNNTSGAVNVDTLSIEGWFNAGANSKDWGGDSYRTAVFSGPNGTGTNLGQVAATVAASSSGLGGSTMATLWTFTFTTSVSIPAGGSVQIGTYGTPFIQFDGANNAGQGYAWDPGCNDYTGLGYGAYAVNTYYHDPTWVLYEGGSQVCEWSSALGTDPETGVPAGGGGCTCPVVAAPSATPSPMGTLTPTPTPTTIGACATTDHLDLQMSVFNGANGGIYACTDQFPDMMFMVNNNNTSGAVNVDTLSIEGWFNAGANSKDWGGDSYRTAVFSGPNGTGTNLGQVAATVAASSSGLGGSTMATLWTFTFTTSVSIPAGGSVQIGTYGTPFIQFDGANNAGQGYAWDPGCNDYTGLGYGAYAVNTYYHDPTWVLYEGGSQVCEWSSALGTDPETGVPAGGGGCTCPVVAAPSATPSPAGTLTPTPTATAISACVATDQLDLQMSVFNGANGGIYACTDQFPDMMFMVNNNNTSAAVDVSTLSIEGWFNGGANTKDWGGDSYRTAVFSGPNGTGTNLGQVAATIAASSSGLGGTMATLWTFTFTTSVSIPAGGSVQIGTYGTPFIQFDGANNAGQGYAWDPGCNDYTGLGYGAYAVGTYYEDPSWVLYESGNPVCEWTTSSTKDPSTGIPAGGATCSCP